MVIDSGRKIFSDKKFEADSFSKNKDYSNILFVRLVAKKIEFKKLDFSYCIFDSAYLRNCCFKDCDFTGCKFINSNLLGSSFSNCKFDYAILDKTYIDNDIFTMAHFSYDNLKFKFIRTLRINYQQIGDSMSVNKAISIELEATRKHLFNAWYSKETYYRKKYKGMSRIKMFFSWLNFKISDFIWGNGESIYKLFRVLIIILLLISIIHTIILGEPNLISSYLHSISISPNIFFGTLTPHEYPNIYLNVIVFVRLTMFGFLISTILKRLNRR